MSDFDFFKPHTFDPDNEADFELKLASIIANPPSKDSLKNIAETVSAKYQWQQSAQIFYNLFNIGLRDKPGKIQNKPAIFNKVLNPILHFNKQIIYR